MITISRQIELDYGHTLPNHYGCCSEIHGHRARVTAYVRGNVINEPGLSEEGMVMDFKFLKHIMMEQIHAVLDHGFAVWEKDTAPTVINDSVSVSTLEFIKARNRKVLITSDPPTAEFLAKWCYERILPHIPEGIELVKIDWHETPSCVVSYEG